MRVTEARRFGTRAADGNRATMGESASRAGGKQGGELLWRHRSFNSNDVRSRVGTTVRGFCWFCIRSRRSPHCCRSAACPLLRPASSPDSGTLKRITAVDAELKRPLFARQQSCPSGSPSVAFSGPHGHYQSAGHLWRRLRSGPPGRRSLPAVSAAASHCSAPCHPSLPAGTGEGKEGDPLWPSCGLEGCRQVRPDLSSAIVHASTRVCATTQLAMPSCTPNFDCRHP